MLIKSVQKKKKKVSNMISSNYITVTLTGYIKLICGEPSKLVMPLVIGIKVVSKIKTRSQ